MNQNITDQELCDLEIEAEAPSVSLLSVNDIVSNYLEKEFPKMYVKDLKRTEIYTILTSFLTYVHTLPDPAGYEDSF